ncbi:hypothetical protein [Streptomyces sp. NPDC056387]|uniref:hypothetical protein n=1 Tax=Streptomyces sp. NPDC056387 TaxID=3345803 RepID=UPI0035D67359
MLVVGARFLLSPQAAGAGYGVPAWQEGDPAYLSVRLAVTPLGDTWTVLRHGGTRAAAFGIRFVPAVAVVLSAALLFVTAS